MNTDMMECFVLFVQTSTGSIWQPEDFEEPFATFECYEDAFRAKSKYRESGRQCVIRYLGPTGGGD